MIKSFRAQIAAKKFEVLLFILFTLVFLSGFTALRLVRDDWSNIANFARGLQNNPTGFLRDVFTNQWLGLNQSRIFFFGWYMQMAVGYLGRFNYVPYYLFILFWHFLSSILLFRILRVHLKSPAFAALLSIAYLSAPANTNVLFWLNNWFFSLPIFFLITQVYFLTFPLSKFRYQIPALFLTTLLGQFSGEQGIAMLYLSPAIFILRALVTLRGEERKMTIISIFVPALLSALALLAYVKFSMVYSVTENTVDYSVERVWVYLVQFFGYLVQTVNLNTEFHGFHSLPFGKKTLLLSTLQALVVIGVFIKMSSSVDWEFPKRRALVMTIVLALFATAGLLPCLYGALTGIRPGASYRYLFVPAFSVTGVLMLLVGICLSFIRPQWRKYAMLPLVGFVIYLSSLSTYTLNRVWRFQQEIDNSIWQRIDAEILPRHTVIITVNLTQDQAQLFPAYYSQAISDFQADWGVSQRLWFAHGRQILVGKRAEEIPGTDKLLVTGYYGDTWETARDSVIFTTYSYGPNFASLKDAKLNVFATYKEFKEFKDQIANN